MHDVLCKAAKGFPACLCSLCVPAMVVSTHRKVWADLS